jgi:hypothetical protein
MVASMSCWRRLARAAVRPDSAFSILAIPLPPAHLGTEKPENKQLQQPIMPYYE